MRAFPDLRPRRSPREYLPEQIRQVTKLPRQPLRWPPGRLRQQPQGLLPPPELPPHRQSRRRTKLRELQPPSPVKLRTPVSRVPSWPSSPPRVLPCSSRP